MPWFSRRLLLKFWKCPNNFINEHEDFMEISMGFRGRLSQFGSPSALVDSQESTLKDVPMREARSLRAGFLSHGGTPKVTQSLYHFSIETQGDLGIPHFKKLPGEFGRYPKQLRSCLWNGKARRKEHMDLLIQNWHCFSFWTLTWIYPNIAAEVYASTHVY